MTELTPFAIYLIFTADNVRTLLVIFALIGGLGGLFLCAFGSIEDEPGVLKLGKPALVVAFASMFLAAAIPSTQTLVAMYGIPALINGTKAAATSEVGQKAYSAVNKLLDGYLSDKAK